MSRNTSKLRYDNPPLNEVAIGISFEPLYALKPQHIGLFWSWHLEEFPRAEQVPPIGLPVSAPGEFLPMARFWLIADDDNDLVQIQRDKFLCNWRKKTDKSSYPSYEHVRDSFLRYKRSFEAFLKRFDLGVIERQVCEITYVNHIMAPHGWRDHSDTKKIFPGLSLLDTSAIGTVKAVNYVCVVDMPDDLGDMSIKFQDGRIQPDETPVLVAELSAKGVPAGGDDTSLSSWFESAHDIIVETFTSLADDDVQRSVWRRVGGVQDV